MASQPKTQFIPLPGGLVAVQMIGGMRYAQDGKVLLLAYDNSILAAFYPEEFDGVAREDVINEFRRLLTDYTLGRPFKLADWLKGNLEL